MSKTARLRRLVTLAGVTSVVVALDQMSKAAIRGMDSAGEVPCALIPGVLELRMVSNAGAAFSIGAQGNARWLFVAIAVLMFFGIAAYLCLEEDVRPVEVVALCCVAAGGVGNLIDRLAFGAVTDFLATTFINFPVFNVADIFVTCGMGVMLASLFFGRRGEETDNR